MKKKEKRQINLTDQDYSDLKQRIQEGKITQDDIGVILSILDLVVSLKNLLRSKKIGMVRLLKQLFGFKTEKNSQKTSTSTPEVNNSHKKRKGRNGREDYTGANKISVDHESLQPGDKCPSCLNGFLKEDKPSVDYDWKGNTPLTLDIYLLQRLLCPTCKESFIAKSPVKETAKTVDDSQDEIKVTRCNKNAFANSVVACLRFMYGVPHYRLEKIQGSMGIMLPASTQYKMVKQVYISAIHVFERLVFLAAQGNLFFADDTATKILDWLAGHGPPTKVTKTPRKKANTTAIISESTEGREIVLYLTGSNAAGDNMKMLLKKRGDSYEAPLYMADGLAANDPGEEHVVIKICCLDHGRRKFHELLSIYPRQCQHVLDELALVYKADREAKLQKLSAGDRQKLHAKVSGPVMSRLGNWMQQQLSSTKVEENSELGRAIKYFLTRWTEFTEFLHTPNVPLSNSTAERAIKKIITHRKNSLFYKTAKGAHVGDVIQSLISTCQAEGINCFKYLAWIQENRSNVQAAPDRYLPWKFTE